MLINTPFWRLFGPLYFAPAEEGGGGAASSGEGTGGEGTPSPQSGQQQGGGGNLPQTQEELDRLIQDRLSRANRGTVKPEELGFKTKAEMEEAFKQYQQIQEQNKTEQEKAIEEARKAARSEAEAEILGKANARLVKSEFLAVAKDKGVVSPQDLYLIAQAEGRFSDISVNDQDEVVGIDDSWWEELLRNRPHLVTQSGDQGQQGGGNPRTPGGNVNGDSSGVSGGRRAPASRIPDARQQELAERYPALRRR